MMYISTGMYNYLDPIDAIRILNLNDIFEIELSAGRSTNMKNSDLNRISKNNDLVVHNYFPNPPQSFVFNLGSTNNENRDRSIQMSIDNIEFASKQKTKVYSFHAPFRVDPSVDSLGRKLTYSGISSIEKTFETFLSSVNSLKEIADSKGVALAIENNVITQKNLNEFGENPLLFTNVDEICRYMNAMPSGIGLLLDIGHLKVSSNTLQFDFIESIHRLKDITTILHLSDNDGISDQNKIFDMNVEFLSHLFMPKHYVSLEIYNADIQDVIRLRENLMDYLC